ncbi:MAG TPA: tetratricopeptide repeat protein [Smithella sp.]|nr:tetratricopeptide repeat protein [Smithella sp.]
MLNKINIGSKKKILIVYILLTLAVVAAFWQVYQYGFVNIDDNIYVTENTHIQSGITLDGIIWAFSTQYAELWNPLIWISFMLDNQLYGLNAAGFHLTNLILHILSTLLLFWLFNRMTGAIWKSAFVAALFALHPLHVESVAWISERKDVLSAFFWMLTLCLYVRYTEKPVMKRYLPVLFGFVFALMSKPMVVTLPVIMILLDYWPLKRFESEKFKSNLILSQLKEKAPFLILSAVFSVMTIYAHHNRSIEHFPLPSRLANALVSFATYIGKTFWPYNMAVYYPFPQQIRLWQVSGALLLMILISVFVIITVKRLPYLFVGWMWYIIAILPVIGILQDMDQAMADRYHYLPSIGIAIMLAWGIPLLFPNEHTRKYFLSAVAIFFLIIMSVSTWKQCGYWKNSIELSKHTLEATKNNFVAHKCLADAFLAEGKNDEAIYHYIEAIRIYPDYADAFNNRGIAYFNQGDKISGCKDAKKACELGTCVMLETAYGKGLCR